MAQLVTARRRGGWGQALLWGTICGFIVVVLDVVVFTLYHLLAPKSFDFGPIVLISLVLLFGAGMLVGQATGRVGAGAVAGLVTGTVSTLVELVILVVLIVVGLFSQLPQQSTGSGEGNLGVLGLAFLIIILIVLAVAALLVFRLIMGAGLGALGALLGRALSPDSGEGPAYSWGPGSPPPGGDVPRPPAGYPSEYPYRPPSSAPLPGATPLPPAISPPQQPAGWPQRPSLRARAVSWWTEQWAVRVGVIAAFALAIVDIIFIFLIPLIPLPILLLGSWIAFRIAPFLPGNADQAEPVLLFLAPFLLISTALLLATGLSAGYKARTADSGTQAGLLAGVLAAGLAAPLDAVLALVSMFFAVFTPPTVLHVFGWTDSFEVLLTFFTFLIGLVLPLLIIRTLIALVGSTLGGLVGALVRSRMGGGSPAEPGDGGMSDAPPGGDSPLPPGYASESPVGSTFPPASAIPSPGVGSLPLATPLLQHTSPSWPAS